MKQTIRYQRQYVPAAIDSNDRKDAGLSGQFQPKRHAQEGMKWRLGRKVFCDFPEEM